MLIVSVALAAMAPVMTKKAQNNMGGNSKWLYTKNGSDITRTGGNVGIGVPANTNPSAKLHIKDGKLLIENNSAISIEIVYDNDTAPVLLRNTKYNTKLVIGPNNWGNTLVSYENDKVTSFMNKNGDVIERTASGDINKTIPPAMLAFFDSNCPPGWTNMADWGWGGRFLRIAGWDNALGVNTPHGQWQDQAVGWHEHDLNPDIRSVNVRYGGGGGEWSVILSGDVQYYDWWARSTRKIKANGAGGADNRPRNIALNLCRKN